MPRISRPRLLALLLVCCCLPALPDAGQEPARIPPFLDATEETGLRFVHFNGMTGEMYYPEIMGPGVALLDYDGDGDLDLYLNQGSMLRTDRPVTEALVPPPEPIPRDRLYRNDLTVTPDGRRQVRLVDVTEASGLSLTDFSTGAATGDFDDDGWTDLYVTVYGKPNRLLRNQGNGTFEDVTEASGTGGGSAWSAGASFADFDADGDLDLYVVEYLSFPLEKNPACYARSSRRDYCGPDGFAPVPDKLFRNRGDGTFEDVTALLVGARPGPGLGVVALDLDGDGRLDFYVANDGAANVLWLQQGDGTFRDGALLAGVAVNRQGRPEAGMGVTAGDYDGDGDEDLFITHLDGETNTLYVQQAPGLFEDRSVESGLGPPSLPYTSFGTRWLDYDNDGRLDLLTVSGAVRIQEHLAQQGDPFPLGQGKQLFRNLGPVRGEVRFEDVTNSAGEAFLPAEVSRGAAFGDLDDDGDTDVVIANNNGPARVLLNQVGSRGRWLGLRLVTRHGRDALGAHVVLVGQGGEQILRRVHADGSFASASDSRVLFGLPTGFVPVKVRISWPDGGTEEWPAPPVGSYLTLRQGTSPAEEAAEDDRSTD